MVNDSKQILNELTIIEDDLWTPQDEQELLQDFASNVYQTQELIKSEEDFNVRFQPTTAKNQAFLVDLRLGTSLEGGIGLIKRIANEQPKAHIIAYSGNPHLKEKALQAGANFFLGKSSLGYETEIRILRESFEAYFYRRYFEQLGYESCSEIYGLVDDIDLENEEVHLICKSEKDSKDVIRYVYPLNGFEKPEKLSINSSVLFAIWKKPGETKIVVKLMEEDYFPEFQSPVGSSLKLFAELKDLGFFETCK